MDPIRRLWRHLVGRLRPPTRRGAADWRAVHSRLKPAELEHLFATARDRYTGDGAIVDLGTWIGGSTAAMAAGLALNPRPAARSRKIHAFDQFVVTAWMAEQKDLPEITGIPVGESFLPVFLRAMSPWAARLEVHPGDFTKLEWTHGPIEVAHVDIMKNWALTNAMLRKVFRELMPGRAIVLHQDFAHYNTVWIHLVMHRLRAHFEPVGQIPGTPTVEFRLTAPIPASLLDREYGFADFDDAEEKAAFAWSRALVGDDFLKLNIDAAEAMLPLHRGDWAEAQRRLDRALERERAYRAEHPAERRVSELSQVQARIRKVAPAGADGEAQ